jgi:hypothetical protein
MYPRREADQSHSRSAEFENEWRYTLLPGRKIFTFLKHKYIYTLLILLQFCETLQYARKAYDVGLCVPQLYRVVILTPTLSSTLELLYLKASDLWQNCFFLSYILFDMFFYPLNISRFTLEIRAGTHVPIFY